MKTYHFILVFCFVFLGVAAASAQTPSADAGLTTNPVYKKDCAKCHGKTAAGRLLGGPGLISDKAAGMSAEDMHNLIVNGKGHMPKFGKKLTSEEIDALVQQVRVLNGK